ncbi:MAG: carbamoyltransferase N-terminal domain-containing protein [Cyanobacteriota bacterium]|jgi:carbamoyltransferase
MITLGINSAYHEVAVAVVRDGVLVAAIEQERINRIKKVRWLLLRVPHICPMRRWI